MATSSLFSSMFNYQSEPNVQLLIKQYIVLPARAQSSAAYLDAYSNISCSNIYFYIQQCVQLPARALCTASFTALCLITNQSQLYSWSTSQSTMFSWLFSSIINYQPGPIFIWLFSSIFNYQPEPNVQLVIHQYVQLPARAQSTAGYSAVCSISSQNPMYSWLFSSIFNYLTEPNVQLVIQQFIQQYVKLAARTRCIAGYSAVYSTISQSPMNIWLSINMLN